MHDVGTGCGSIALALLDERPDLQVTRPSPTAAAARWRARTPRGSGSRSRSRSDAGLPDGDYDLVVANLPYIREDDWHGMQPEIVHYEPREAFVSGADGLDAISELIGGAPSGTRVALEHGEDQAAEMRAMLYDAESRPDLANWERITVGRVPSARRRGAITPVRMRCGWSPTWIARDLTAGPEGDHRRRGRRRRRTRSSSARRSLVCRPVGHAPDAGSTRWSGTVCRVTIAA